MSNHLKSPFLESVRQLIRLKHLSYGTEEAYLGWIRRYILFHDKRHPKEIGAAEVRMFLTHLAVEGRVAASTGIPVCLSLFSSSGKALSEIRPALRKFPAPLYPGRLAASWRS